MKVAIYCRLSHEDDDKLHENDESESIQNQKSMLINYAIEQNWDIYNIYCDEDYSGIDSLRPEFNKLLSDAQNHKFDIVLCKTQSRFTRDMEIVEKYLHNKFVEWNIRFISLVDHVDTLDKGNKKSRQINGLVNEWYLEDLSENIRKTFDNKRKQGLHIGSFVCYGYTRNPQNKNKIIIDHNVSGIIQLIFNLYEQGTGITKIAQVLNTRNILPPTKYKQSQGLNFKNQNKNIEYWCESTIRKILKDEVYIGNLVQGYNKKISYKSKKIIAQPQSQWIIVENTHPPIISKEQFYKVQEILKSKTRKCKNGEMHLFTNKLICAGCGSKLYKCTNDRGYVYFSCKNSKKLYKTCTPHSIGYNNLKSLITDKIREKILEFYDFNSINDNMFLTDNTSQLLENKILSISNEINNITNAIKELYLNKSANKIPESTFQVLNSDFISDKIAKEQELQNLKSNLSNLSESKIDVQSLKENTINELKNFSKLNREIINSFINYIEIDEKNKKTNSQDIIIHWNF